jgi:hypothetical protein
MVRSVWFPLLRKERARMGHPPALVVQAGKASATRHCETPVYAAGSQIFILRTLIWGTRGVKGKAHCAVSVVSHSCAKDAQEWGTPGVKGKAHCAISVVPTLAQRTRKNGAPPALVVQASKASATRQDIDLMDKFG